jgi:hypothetical protein
MKLRLLENTIWSSRDKGWTKTGRYQLEVAQGEEGLRPACEVCV